MCGALCFPINRGSLRDITIENRCRGFCSTASSVIHNLTIVFHVRSQVLTLDSGVILNRYLGFGLLIHVKEVVALELQALA